MNRLLAAIIGAGLGLRLLFLGRRQLGTEELMQAIVVRSDSLQGILDALVAGMYFPAPLDYLFQRILVLPIGETAWALRLHAVIFGTLSIWVFARIARQLFGDRVALYSAALFALYPLHHHYSQEARPHALFTLLTLVSYDQLLRRVASRGRSVRDWWLLAAVLALLMYSSFLGVVVLLSQAAGLLTAAYLARRSNQAGANSGEETAGADLPAPARIHGLGYAAAGVLACLMFLPWSLWAFAKPEIARASEVLYPGVLIRFIKELGDNSYLATGILFLGAVVGFRAMRLHGRRQSLAWLVTWFLVPIPAVMILAVWSGYFVGKQHLLHATPPLILLAGYGLSYVGERLTILPSLPYRISSPAIVYGLFWVLTFSWIAYHHRDREIVDWKGAASFLQGTVREGDAVSMPRIGPLLEYYAPSLTARISEDLDPGPGGLRQGTIERRFVVCYQGLRPEPCAAFLRTAAKDKAWLKREFRGITIFMRRKT